MRRSDVAIVGVLCAGFITASSTSEESWQNTFVENFVEAEAIGTNCKKGSIETFAEAGLSDVLHEELENFRFTMDGLGLGEYTDSIVVSPKYALLCDLEDRLFSPWPARGYSATKTSFFQNHGMDHHIMFVLDRKWVGNEDFRAYVRHEIAHGIQNNSIWYIEPTAMFLAEQDIHKDRPMHDVNNLWLHTTMRENCRDDDDIDTCREDTVIELAKDTIVRSGILNKPKSLYKVVLPPEIINEMEPAMFQDTPSVLLYNRSHDVANYTIRKVQESSEVRTWVQFLTEADIRTQGTTKITIVSEECEVIISSSDGHSFSYETQEPQTEGVTEYFIQDPAMLATVEAMLNHDPSANKDSEDNSPIILETPKVKLGKTLSQCAHFGQYYRRLSVIVPPVLIGIFLFGMFFGPNSKRRQDQLVESPDK